ncbi:Rieske (2Fe-2S) protein [Lacisediminihabitans sp. H27-G8]|uniref:Rieske (2Fe-2S) protein n=1 Tax=Lacisediminihabitans sp. H27-G8 TaxID=3111909 RepID=UPI0038FCC57A
MTASPSLTRRALISAGSATVVGAGALALAACSSPATGGSAGGSGSGSPTSKIAAGTEVAKVADIPVGGTKSAKIGDAPVLLSQPTAGTVMCFSAICTHQGCTVGAAAKEFDCPCHGSKFNAETGAVLNGPAQTGLTAIAVKVSGDSVVTA